MRAVLRCCLSCPSHTCCSRTAALDRSLTDSNQTAGSPSFSLEAALRCCRCSRVGCCLFLRRRLWAGEVYSRSLSCVALAVFRGRAMAASSRDSGGSRFCAAQRPSGGGAATYGARQRKQPRRWVHVTPLAWSRYSPLPPCTFQTPVI